jgi:N-acetylmuramoyl-L-alanine amidase
MRVNKLVVHHSASPRATTTRDIIEGWHLQRGFRSIGYHKVIEGDGAIKDGRSEEQMGAHTRGANANSLGICVVGNFEHEEPTQEQISSLISVLDTWCKKHKLTGRDIYGHGEVPGGTTATACPGKNLKHRLDLIRLKVGEGVEV